MVDSLAVETLPLDRLRLVVAGLAASDHLRLGRPAEAVLITARHLIVDMVESLPLIGVAPTEDSVAARLWSRLSAKPPTDEALAALEAALIVMADHGVSPSALASRIAAAYRADLYGVVQSGLAIMSGAWHGGRALSAEEMLDEIRRVGDVEVVVGDLYRRGAIPCLGQPRYPGSDPRTAIMAEVLESALPGHGAVHALAEVTRLTKERGLPSPSVELAVAAMAHGFEFTKGASEAIFAIGRSAGWIAHGMEAYGLPSPGPPTFNYVGSPRVSEPAGNGQTGATS
jgi:citrate synthase